MGFILGTILLSGALYLALNWRTLKQKGERRFGGAFSRPSPDEPSPMEEFFRRRAAQRSSAATFPARDEPRGPVRAVVPVHQANIFETNFCDLCRNLPQVQYRSNKTQAVLEFCRVHARLQHEALTANDFVITVDQR